jgi:hypothetical protein
MELYALLTVKQLGCSMIKSTTFAWDATLLVRLALDLKTKTASNAAMTLSRWGRIPATQNAILRIPT